MHLLAHTPLCVHSFDLIFSDWNSRVRLFRLPHVFLFIFFNISIPSKMLSMYLPARV